MTRDPKAPAADATQTGEVSVKDAPAPKKAEHRRKKDEDQIPDGAPKMETPEDPAPPPTPDERVAPPADEEAPRPPDPGLGSPMAPRVNVFATFPQDPR